MSARWTTTKPASAKSQTWRSARANTGNEQLAASIGDHRAGACLVAVIDMEQRLGVRQGRAVAAVRLEKGNEDPRLGLCGPLAHTASEVREGPQIVVHQNLPGDADLLGPGLDLVGL